jgi:hypothetical protein
MGGSSYSDDFYKHRAATRAATGTPVFIHDAAVRSGAVAAGVHASLDIKGKIREARDSAAHPMSNAIGVVFDETGSMAGVPPIMQAELPQLMGLLLRKAYIVDPQILFGAIGDYTAHEAAPLQLGQFESGLEMDDNITHIYLEGNGGGGYPRESYQNALYYFAYRTRTDAWEKRGKKGYLFLIGDEMAYERSTKAELKALIGDGAESDVTFEQIMTDVLKKWEVFFIIPKGTNHYDDPKIETFWRKHLGENVIKLEDPKAVCQAIGLTIGLHEGTVDSAGMAKDLKDVGASNAIVHAATASVDAIAKSRALTRVGTGGALPGAKDRSDKIERL